MKPLPENGNDRSSQWAALKNPMFRPLWIATVVSNVGAWIHDAGAAWMIGGLLLAAYT